MPKRWSSRRGARALYLATAEPRDDEMRDAHRRPSRAARGPALGDDRGAARARPRRLRAAARPMRPVLVDCLTLWLVEPDARAAATWRPRSSACVGGAAAAQRPGGDGRERGRARHRARQCAGARLPRPCRPAQPARRRRVPSASCFLAAGPAAHAQRRCRQRLACARSPPPSSPAFSAPARPAWCAICSRHAEGRRIALVINEFGELGIDRELLLGCGVAAAPRTT